MREVPMERRETERKTRTVSNSRQQPKQALVLYRVTSPIRNIPPVGPYSSPMPRILEGS